MRCDCCNRNLNDFESTLKSITTGDYTNMCRKCLKGLGIQTIGRSDLSPEEDAPEDFDSQELNYLDNIGEENE